MDNDNCTGMYTVYNPQEYLENAVRLRQACYDVGVPVVQIKQTYERLCRVHQYSEARLRAGATVIRMVTAQTRIMTSTNPVVKFIRDRVLPLIMRRDAVQKSLCREC